MRLIALKANRYGTRHLAAGEEFDMADRYARTLIVTGLARDASTVRRPVDDVTQLRTDAQGLGIIVDRRWGAKRLQAEIDLALKGS